MEQYKRTEAIMKLINCLFRKSKKYRGIVSITYSANVEIYYSLYYTYYTMEKTTRNVCSMDVIYTVSSLLNMYIITKIDIRWQ